MNEHLARACTVGIGSQAASVLLSASSPQGEGSCVHHQHEREEKDPAAGCRSAVTQQLACTAKRTAESTICAAFVPFRHRSKSRRLLSRAGGPWRRKKISKITLSHHNTRAVPPRWSRCPAHVKILSPAPPSAPSPSSLHGPPGCARQQYS